MKPAIFPSSTLRAYDALTAKRLIFFGAQTATANRVMVTRAMRQSTANAVISVPILHQAFETIDRTSFVGCRILSVRVVLGVCRLIINQHLFDRLSAAESST